ncbi:MAG: hypothetical protein AAGI17_00080 [Planctomycetota bacterium]
MSSTVTSRARTLTTGFLAGVVAVLAFNLFLGSPSPASADMTQKDGMYTAMTTLSTDGEEVLYIVDNNSQNLLVYRHTGIVGSGSAGINLIDRQALPQLFSAARAQAFGR